MIYCSITGFGETGPYKHLPGYDFIIQAMSGLMSITGDNKSGPQKFGVAITDINRLVCMYWHPSGTSGKECFPEGGKT